MLDQRLATLQCLLLQMIGEEVDRSPVQVILKWALQSGMVCETIWHMAAESASASSPYQHHLPLDEIDLERTAVP